MTSLPNGPLTLLFTDIEGSTQLACTLGDRFEEVLEAHNRILRASFSIYDGVEVDSAGDGFFVAFARARNAVAAAVEAQRALVAEPWLDGATVKVRMGLHTGEVTVSGDSYRGVAVHRAARIATAARGGQIVISQSTHTMVDDVEALIPDLSFLDLGDHLIRDFDRPVRLYQLVAPGLTEPFSRLRSLDEPKRAPSAGDLRFQLLGSLEVEKGGDPVQLGGQKQRAVLAILCLNAGQVVSTDRLIDQLWGEQPPKTAPTSLQNFISQLRKTLGANVVVTKGPGYLLDISAEQIDLNRFESLVSEARAFEPKARAERLREALEIWRGAPLADFTFEPFAETEIARLEELRSAALEDRVAADLERGAAAELVGELESLVRLSPLRERLRGQLMLALYRSGRQADALRAYQDARHALVDELGIEPSPALQELHASILRQGSALQAQAVAQAGRTNLPSPSTSLIGREREFTDVLRLLRDARLVTLTGPGGGGKTRLALEIAAELVDDYPQGVWWVPLASLRDPALVESTIEQVVGAKEGLAEHLRHAQALLLLDNFEQLVEAAPQLSELLAEAEDVRLLVTSREPLHVRGEREYLVPPLEDADAAALFTERAQSIRPGFKADGFVPEICRRLDGLPLAIELAAARVKVLDSAALLERLKHPLSVLTGGTSDAPERQRTLEATIAWSYDLLRPEQKELFARLAVFAGGFTLEAAEQVCETNLDALATLVEQSLVSPTEQGRFFMLETIREFAQKQLQRSGEAHRAGRRHAEHFAALAKDIDSRIRSPERSMLLNRLEAEHDNLRAALGWLLASDPNRALDLTLHMDRFWMVRSHVREGDYWYTKVLSSAYDIDPTLRAHALREAGDIAEGLGEDERARALWMQSLALAEKGGSKRPVARALMRLGRVKEALNLFRELGDDAGIAQVLLVMGDEATEVGDFASARRHLEEAERLIRQAQPDGFYLPSILHGLADCALEQGSTEEAFRLYFEALELAIEFESPWLIAGSLGGLAGVAVKRGQPERAACLWGALEVIEDSHGIRVVGRQRKRYERLIENFVDATVYGEALIQGREMSIEATIACALAVGD